METENGELKKRAMRGHPVLRKSAGAAFVRAPGRKNVYGARSLDFAPVQAGLTGPAGKLLHHMHHSATGGNRAAEAGETVKALGTVEIEAIANAWDREPDTERLCCSGAARFSRGVMVNESGASIYSARRGARGFRAGCHVRVRCPLAAA
jgi:hypothetical protein